MIRTKRLRGIKLPNNKTIFCQIQSGIDGPLGDGWFPEKFLRRLRLSDSSLITHTTKTATLSPNPGNWNPYNPLHCIRPVFKKGSYEIIGTINSVGLTNPGILAVCAKLDHLKRTNPDKLGRLVVSILGKTPDELAAMVRLLIPFAPYLTAAEINASCPNISCNLLQESTTVVEGCKVVWKILHQVRLPVIMKLSVTHDIDLILPRISGYADAIAINSVPWPKYSNGTSPLSHLPGIGGGVSGFAAQSQTWDFAQKITERSDIPVIWPSVWRKEDIQTLIDRGAAAIGLGAVVLIKPWSPRWIRNFK